MSLKVPQVQGFEPSHPKKTLEAKQKQYYVVVFFLGLFGHCFVLQVHLEVGNFFVWGGGKRCSRSQQLLFFFEFSAAKYVTQTPFVDTMYMMKSLRATSFPALAARADSKHLVDTHPNQSAIPVV